MNAAIVWFRLDLRVEDNLALLAAAQRKGPVVCVYVHAPEEEKPWEPGAAVRWWLHHSLTSLDAELQKLQSRLILRSGPTLPTLLSLAREVGATAVYWNRRYEPAVIARDTAVKSGLREAGIEAESFNANLLFEPWEVQTKTKQPYQVFTPFWKCAISPITTPPNAPEPAPTHLRAPSVWPNSLPLEQLKLLPKIAWDTTMRQTWKPGESGARGQLQRFLDKVTDYSDTRDKPGVDGTSAISPHLHFGEISPRTLWHCVLEKYNTTNPEALGKGPLHWLKEVAWREFAHHLLYHFPHTTEEPLRPEFAKFPWREDESALRAWQRGETGYPLVDAGMRQLYATGWMHNRVRMVVASFLVKHLRLRWQLGAEWFWDTLVDADLANNTMGWQWTAGCGADAAPYFRIFNPMTQSEKFDENGDYIRTWVPELAKLPSKWIHQPWEHDDRSLASFNVVLGKNYPRPIVDHAKARDEALAAYADITKGKK
jgi:deoxyribodipyrimidine photo-lyase